MSAQKVIKLIRQYSKFLICAHIDLEGDALGSELALASLLRKLGKKAFIVNNDPTPKNYSFLPGAKKIYHRLRSDKFQAAFVIDCPNRKRIGSIAKLIDNTKPVVNIDHHIKNKNFGKINWVDPQASSTGEMIYRLFRLSRVKLDRRDALNIYTAMLTDTGSFRYPNTTSTAFYISSQLMKLGVQPAKIYAKIYEDNSVQDVTVITKIISRMSFAAQNKIAWVKVNKNIFKKIKDRQKIVDKILDLARSISSVKIVIVFCQQDRRLIKLSFRSKGPINVQRLAKLYGGGGHRLASGCVVKRSLKQAEKMVLLQAKKLIRPI